MIIKHIDQLKRRRPQKGMTIRFLSPEESRAAIEEDKRSRQLFKLPQEEYTRILLAAKEGEIKPGEADRQIRRMGGRSSIRPLPRPPA